MNTNNNSIETSSFTFDPSLQDKNLVKMDPTIKKKFVLVKKDDVYKFGMLLPNTQTVRLIEKTINDINDYQISDTITVVGVLRFLAFPSMDFIGDITYSIISSMIDDDERVVNSDPPIVKIDPTLAKNFVLVENNEGIWFGLVPRIDHTKVRIIDKDINIYSEFKISDSVKIVANFQYITFPSLDFLSENKSINDTFT